MSTTSLLTRCKPRVGVVATAYPGYHLGEELAPAKYAEMLEFLADKDIEVRPAPAIITDTGSARAAGRHLHAAQVDCLLVVITTFVPDQFIVDLLRECDKPVFLWAVEREMGCISLVCGPLITATLYNLEKPYRLYGADIPDAAVCAEFLTFARAAMLRERLRAMRVGMMGGKPSIMFSMATDEFTLVRKLGVTIVDLPVQELYCRAQGLADDRVRAFWLELSSRVGQVQVATEDGLRSSRYALAMRELAREHHLDAVSLNCFPHLKSQVCLAIACLNDAGIAAACEGDLHSTILMRLLQMLSGTPAFNGDFLRLYPEDNAVLFSHCGAGALSLARCADDICLHASIETQDGLAVKYATQLPGAVTLVNMMLGRGTLRLAAMAGEGVETDLSYAGTPLRVRFEDDMQSVLQRLARCGAGHHWNGASGHYLAEFRLLCEWLDIPFTVLAPQA